jgi:hypothetical protein
MKQILLTKNQFALVDNQDYKQLNRHLWHYTTGYAATYINGKHVLMHRLIMKPRGKQIIDHANHDRLDNRRINLRLCNHSQNGMNIGKSWGSSKYKGVSKHQNQWRVQISKNYKRVFAESAPTELQAAMIYDLNAPIYFGEYAKLNFSSKEIVSGERHG